MGYVAIWCSVVASCMMQYVMQAKLEQCVPKFHMDRLKLPGLQPVQREAASHGGSHRHVRQAPGRPCKQRAESAE